MAVSYVQGGPLVEHGQSGNVLVHYLLADDTITLSFRSDDAYQSAMEAQGAAYEASTQARSRRLFPALPWDVAS